jgi:ferredoxin-NADP reductase
MPMIPPKPCRVKLSEKKILNSKFVQYHFEMLEPSRFEFAAGQYVSLLVQDEGHRRSYSIFSDPQLGHAFELFVDITPNGVGVQYLNNLQFGQEAQVLAPLGMFTVGEEATAKPIVFIATGAGIAPFRSMILDELHNKKNTQQIQLYWGLRHEEHMCWQDEFQELAESYPNFHFHPVLSQALPEWPLCRGHVTDCLVVHDLLPDAHYYLCGNERMIADTMKLLGERGVQKANLHHEKFY